MDKARPVIITHDGLKRTECRPIAYYYPKSPNRNGECFALVACGFGLVCGYLIGTEFQEKSFRFVYKQVYPVPLHFNHS